MGACSWQLSYGYRRFSEMNQPKIQTDDPPLGGISPDYNPTGTTPHGIPQGLADADVTGRPDDNRLATEVAVQKIEQD